VRKADFVRGLEDLKPGNNGQKTSEQTENDRVRAQILANLDALGARTIGDDSLIFTGDKFILPANMKGKIRSAVEYLTSYEEQQEKKFEFSRVFNYRPWDGANAFQRAMRRVFGTTGTGVSIQTMFGEIKPEFKTINVSTTETIQVPWRRVGFSPLEAEFTLFGANTEDFGIVFKLSVEAPRKYRSHIEAFFQVVENELKTNSIYKGKAFTGGGEPQFLDLNNIPPVIYTDEVMVQLETNMWSLLRYSDTMRKSGIELKRAVLMEGPYGTGKTLAGLLTAREAVENGWTFILARTGKDDLMEVLQTAQLYAPAVVWYEDIDVVAQGSSDQQISVLLDRLDGITNKGAEVLAGFTTNHVQKIQKGVLRPGRLSAVISIEGLDSDGFQKLVKALVPDGQLAPDIDFDRVGKAFDGMLPAFAKEAIARAMRYSITRNQGKLGVIETDDLVHAANGLRPQLELMERAQEGVKKPTLDATFKSLFANQAAELLGDVAIVDEDGDENGMYFPPAEKLLNGSASN
jgi:transitional endoplasmic reticulum ATPase